MNWFAKLIVLSSAIQGCWKLEILKNLILQYCIKKTPAYPHMEIFATLIFFFENRKMYFKGYVTFRAMQH